MKQIIISLSILLGCVYCNTSEYGHSVPKKNESIEGIRIAWDYSSMQQIAERGSYPRLLRLKDRSVIAIYETMTGNIAFKRSYDNGSNWGEATEVFSQFVYTNLKGKSTVVRIANPEIIQLKTGEIVIGCNYRPAKNEVAPFSIVVRRSIDNGKTWLPPQALYGTEPRFTDGCWEPSFLELPNGELQVYFANENPYLESDEQEISMLNSLDKGATWTEKPKTVCFRKERRDGMPVAEIIDDEIVVVIEDNKIDRFKPYTVRTKLTDNWSTPILTNSRNREYALTEKILDSAYLGAPYFLKLPSGETLISYQTNENRDVDWELSTMEVAIGDKSARNFNRRTQPFNVPLEKEAKWNSLALWDDSTIIAFAASNFKTKHIAPWIVKGRIIPELVINDKNINSYPIFIGSEGETNLRAGFGVDTDHLHVKCKVADKKLYSFQSDDKSDGVYLYLNIGTDIYKIWSAYDGKTKLWKKQNNNWKQKNTDKLQSISTITENGYELELVIPKNKISDFSKKTIRIGMALSAYDDDKTGYTEWLVNSTENDPNTWLKVETK